LNFSPARRAAGGRQPCPGRRVHGPEHPDDRPIVPVYRPDPASGHLRCLRGHGRAGYWPV